MHPRDAREIASERRWPDHGVWRFPCRPELDALTAPALWLATASPSTVHLQAAPAGSGGIPPARIVDRPDVSEDRVCASGRYLAISASDATHRLVLPSGDEAPAYSCTIDPDLSAELRLAATSRLLGHLGLSKRAKIDRLTPTRFQQRRLSLMLAILDALDPARGDPATVRGVAARFVYRNLRQETAIVWKASSQRRQTQRLIAEAKQLRDGGYRALLLGNILKGHG